MLERIRQGFGLGRRIGWSSGEPGEKISTVKFRALLEGLASISAQQLQEKAFALSSDPEVREFFLEHAWVVLQIRDFESRGGVSYSNAPDELYVNTNTVILNEFFAHFTDRDPASLSKDLACIAGNREAFFRVHFERLEKRLAYPFVDDKMHEELSARIIEARQALVNTLEMQPERQEWLLKIFQLEKRRARTCRAIAERDALAVCLEIQKYQHIQQALLLEE